MVREQMAKVKGDIIRRNTNIAFPATPSIGEVVNEISGVAPVIISLFRSIKLQRGAQL